MNWNHVIKRRPPRHRIILAWTIIGLFTLVEPFLTPYMWRAVEDIRHANQYAPPRRPTVRYQRPRAR